MVSAYRQAQAIFRIIRGNPILIEAEKEKFKAAALSATSTSGGFQITDATVNGQSFTGKATTTPADRVEVLRLLMVMIEKDSSGATKTRARFL
jgi:hypothetical protein